MAERHHEVTFMVRVPVFGDPEKEDPKILLSVARALHHMVKPGCKVAQAKIGGVDRWVTLDAKGDDMGHHPDHPVPLIEVPDASG